MNEIEVMRVVAVVLGVACLVLLAWAMTERGAGNSIIRAYDRQHKDHHESRQQWESRAQERRHEAAALNRQVVFWRNEAARYGCPVPVAGSDDD